MINKRHPEASQMEPSSWRGREPEEGSHEWTGKTNDARKAAFLFGCHCTSPLQSYTSNTSYKQDIHLVVYNGYQVRE